MRFSLQVSDTLEAPPPRHPPTVYQETFEEENFVKWVKLKISWRKLLWVNGLWMGHIRTPLKIHKENFVVWSQIHEIRESFVPRKFPVCMSMYTHMYSCAYVRIYS